MDSSEDHPSTASCFMKEPAPGPDSGFLSGAISTEQPSEYELKPQNSSSLDKYSRLDSGLDLSSNSTLNDSPLHLAVLQHCKTNNLPLIQALLASTPSLANELNEVSQTALHYAALLGEHSVCRLLLEHGAQVVQDDDGNTPLHYAVRSGDGETVAVLVGQCDPDLYNYEGQSPLHTCITHSSSQSLLHLLLRHCNPNLRELKAGRSSLHLAIERGDIPAVRTLLQAGADLRLEDYSGENPYEYAVESGRMAAAKEVLAAGGGGWVRIEERESDEEESAEEEQFSPNLRIPVTCS